MDSQQRISKSLFLDKNRNLLNEIINIEKFKKLDNKYMVTEICRDLKLKYIIDCNEINIYYKSFVMNIAFNKNIISNISVFIDPEIFNREDKDKFMLFIKNLKMKKNLNISVDNFEICLYKILDKNIKELKFKNNNLNIYLSKIINQGKELIFIKLNA